MHSCASSILSGHSALVALLAKKAECPLIGKRRKHKGRKLRETHEGNMYAHNTPEWKTEAEDVGLISVLVFITVR